MSFVPRQVLGQLLADYGVTLLGDPARVDALLADLCGAHLKERFLLVYALRERIPVELRNQRQDGVALRLRLSLRLQKRYGFSAEAALWAVESWSSALNTTAPAQDLTLNDRSFGDVEEVMLQILEQEPLTSQEVATILKTESQIASGWLEQLQKADKIERKWLKHRSPHYPCYQAVSAKERLAAEVEARKTTEQQLAEADLARREAEKSAEMARKEEQQRLSDRMKKLVATRQKAERRADSAEKRADEQTAARKWAERRADEEEDSRKRAERRADEQTAARKRAERRADEEEDSRKRAERRADEQTAARKRAERRADEQTGTRKPRSQTPNSSSKRGCFSTLLLGLSLLTFLGQMIQ